MESIYGIVPPMTTPFDDEGNVDLGKLRADVRYLIETAQVHGLAVCGSTGEGHTITTEETRQISAVAVEEETLLSAEDDDSVADRRPGGLAAGLAEFVFERPLAEIVQNVEGIRRLGDVVDGEFAAVGDDSLRSQRTHHLADTVEMVNAPVRQGTA